MPRAKRPRGVALAWHCLRWEELLELARRAEALGYAALYVDGDVSMLPRHPEREALHGWTRLTALLASTQRIPIGSIRLVHHWNAALLASAAASLERIAPGRQRFLISVGGRPADPRFGLPMPPVAERIRWLDETLGTLRALWKGEAVSLRGDFVQLEEARVAPAPPAGGIDIAVAAKGQQLLDLVARHAQVWDINLPPIPARVAHAAANLAESCVRFDRDPKEIRRQMWVFTRISPDTSGASTRAEFRRLNPWFQFIPDKELDQAMVVGSAHDCGVRLDAIADELDLDLTLVDLSGLDAAASMQYLEALAPLSVDGEIRTI